MRIKVQILLAIDVESKQKVDELVNKAVNAGGSTYADPKDYGWMYYHSFADLDGHQWELMYLDETAVPADPANAQELSEVQNQ
jgi:uncharacterized protein